MVNNLDLVPREKAHVRQLLKFLGGEWRTPANGGQSSSSPNILKPTTPFFAIGDIHGCVALLKDLLARIDPDNDQNLIFLGDYVDRGPQSAETLSLLFKLSRERPDQVVCLKGNHEKMMCEFVDDPLDRGKRWLRNGGLDTLRSYGIDGLGEQPTPDEALDACDALEKALPKGMLEWLRELPLTWNSGNVWCVHAGMDPRTTPQRQRSGTLLWGHRDFMKLSRGDGICVVHGHTIVDAPANANGRVSIDTGAYVTGRLTAARIADQQCTFICT